MKIAVLLLKYIDSSHNKFPDICSDTMISPSLLFPLPNDRTKLKI